MAATLTPLSNAADKIQIIPLFISDSLKVLTRCGRSLTGVRWLY
jgi:hypothetical protein